MTITEKGCFYCGLVLIGNFKSVFPILTNTMRNLPLDAPDSNPTQTTPNLLPIGALVFITLFTLSHVILKSFDIVWVVLPINPYVSLIIGHVVSIAVACFLGMRISRKIWSDIERGVTNTKTMVIRYSVYLFITLVFQYVFGYVLIIIVAALSTGGPSGFWKIMSYETLIGPMKPFILVAEMAVLVFALSRRR